jgi:hypothetical protein
MCRWFNEGGIQKQDSMKRNIEEEAKFEHTRERERQELSKGQREREEKELGGRERKRKEEKEGMTERKINNIHIEDKQKKDATTTKKVITNDAQPKCLSSAARPKSNNLRCRSWPTAMLWEDKAG